VDDGRYGADLSTLVIDQGKAVEHLVFTRYGREVVLNGASNYAGTGPDALRGGEYLPEIWAEQLICGVLLGFQGLRCDIKSGNWYARARYENPAQGD